MLERLRHGCRWGALPLLMILLVTAARADEPKLAPAITKGQRVFTCGHSFHVWVPGIVADLCKKAEIAGHSQAGLSSIGGPGAGLAVSSADCNAFRASRPRKRRSFPPLVRRLAWPTSPRR